MKTRNRTTLKLAAALTLVSSAGCVMATDEAEPPTETTRAELATTMLNPRRSLIETNTTLLEPVELDHPLHWIAQNAGVTPTPALFHNLFFNLYNDKANDVFGGRANAFPHRPCDDPLYQAILNNFPFQCPRTEGDFAVGSATQAPEMANWKAIALVNRIDLAPANGAHCGEQRLVMAKENGPGRDFIIFEAQIPNPSDTNDPCACAPIADFWANLSSMDDVSARQLELGNAFFFGHEKLRAAGFGPFLSAGHFTIGTGQIRTNNFAQFPWTLRELKIVEHSGLLWPIPMPVASNLHAPLLADGSSDPRAAKCKDSFLNAFSGLLPDDPNLMALGVDPACWDAESPNDFNQGNYATQLFGNPNLASAVQAKLTELGSDLTPDQIMNRATFAGSCIGCHQESNGADLGHSINAPSSGFFVHVDENVTEDCGDNTTCFAVSPALANSFLPHRLGVMEKLRKECRAPVVVTPAPIASEAPVFNTGDDLDAEALKAQDEAGKPVGDTIGGAPVTRAH